MNNRLIPFEFEGNAVRVIIVNDVEWWILADVCKVLEVENSRDVARRLDDDEKDDVDCIDTIGRVQQMTAVNESGLYTVSFESRKPIAKRFRKWVTSEVLPSIRKTGSYHHGEREDLLTAMQMIVQPISARFGEHGQLLNNHEQRLAIVEGKVVDLDEYRTAVRTELAAVVRANVTQPRKEFLDTTKRQIVKEYLRQNPTGLDPTGQVRIVSDDGTLIRGIGELHHMNGPFCIGFNDGLPVERTFHDKLHADKSERGPDWRLARTAHQAFLDRSALPDLFGQLIDKPRNR
jgi:prophage antirepressor-like protein